MFEKILMKEVVAPVAIIAFSIVTYMISSRVIRKVFQVKNKRINEKRQQTFIGLINHIVKYFIVIVALMMILEVYGIDTKSLVASLGVLSLVVGLALQDILKDFIVGCSIIFENQFSVGDTVTIDDFTGTVIDLGLKTTRLKAYTGEIKIISNRNITEVINHTIAENNALVDVTVDYDSNLKEVKQLLDELCKNMTEELSLAHEAECLGVEELGENGIRFRIAIPALYSSKFSLARQFRERIKEELEQNGITIPYSQVVIHDGKRV